MSKLMNPTLDEAEEQWRHELQFSQDKTRASMIEHAVKLAAFMDACDAKSGGSNFKQCVHDWLGYSPSQASKLVAIGREQLFLTAKELPESPPRDPVPDLHAG